MLDWLATIPIELKALLLGIVEGATEFLPVSSTGHLVLFGEALSFTELSAPTFDISIQMGAMFAVIWFYRKNFRKITANHHKHFVQIILIAFLPVAFVGFFFGEFIMRALFSPIPVGFAFIVGGILILYVEKDYKKNRIAVRTSLLTKISPIDALKIGLIQVLSLIPGTSRSGAVIIGGMYIGLSRQMATQFSFFLAVPVIFSAGIYSLFLSWESLVIDDLPVFTVGFISSFVSALIVIKWLINYVQKRNLKIFAWYRIVVGVIIIIAW